MNEDIEWLRKEISKRLGPWEGVNGKGNPETKQQLYTSIVIEPARAIRLLELAESGHATQEAQTTDAP